MELAIEPIENLIDPAWNSYRIKQVNGNYVFIKEVQKVPKILIEIDVSKNAGVIKVAGIHEILLCHFKVFPEPRGFGKQACISYTLENCFIMDEAVRVILLHIDKNFELRCQGCDTLYDTKEKLYYHKNKCRPLWNLNDEERKLINELQTYTQQKLIRLFLLNKKQEIYFSFYRGKLDAWPFDRYTFQGFLHSFELNY